MKRIEQKIKVVNKILASRTEFGAEFFTQSNCALDFALSEGAEICSTSEFAKAMIKIYEPSANLEYVDISDFYFEPLFLIGTLSDSIKRLAGCSKPILVVEGLEKSALRGGKNWSQKKRIEYAQNLVTVEDIILRYEKCVPNLEIIFL